MYQVAPQINIFQKTRVLSPNQGTRFNLEAGKISVRVTYGAEMSVMSKNYDQLDFGIQFDQNHTSLSVNAGYFENKPPLSFLQLY
jgi:hypothetical protein